MKSSEKSVLDRYLNLTKISKVSESCDHSTSNTLTSTNVYINPNFKPQTSTIHINPTSRIKPLVHINPKIMKSINNPSKSIENNCNKSIENNSVTVISNTKNSVQEHNSIKKSVYVNPKLMKKLSSSVQYKPLEQKQITVNNITHPSCSRLKFIKSTNSSKMIHSQTRTNNSNILILSQRKLIRVKRGSKRSLSMSQIELCRIKKSPNLLKNMKSSPQKVMKTKVINALQQSIDKNTKFLKPSLIKPKINKYRIDRTESGTTSIKKQISMDQKKNVYVLQIEYVKNTLNSYNLQIHSI